MAREGIHLHAVRHRLVEVQFGEEDNRVPVVRHEKGAGRGTWYLGRELWYRGHHAVGEATRCLGTPMTMQFDVGVAQRGVQLE